MVVAHTMNSDCLIARFCLSQCMFLGFASIDNGIATCTWTKNTKSSDIPNAWNIRIGVINKQIGKSVNGMRRNLAL